MRISDWSSDVCSSDLPLAVSDDVAAVRCWRDDDGLQQAAVLDGRGQCINLGLVELPANLRGVWINVSERKALKPPSCLELGIRGDGRKIHRVHIEVGKALLRRSEEHTSELQSLMRNSYAVFCLKTKNDILSLIYILSL